LKKVEILPNRILPDRIGVPEEMDWERGKKIYQKIGMEKREDSKKGFYLAIEGIDTAGKTTQINRLQARIPTALFIKEPGFTSVGKKLREIVLFQEIHSRTELLLFLADRTELIERVIRPNRSKLIISDRSLVSGIAYGVAGGEGLDQLIRFNKFATGGILPDHVVILKLTYQELERRLKGKKRDRIETRGITYLLKIQTLLEEATARLGIPTTILDASLPPELITAQIFTLLPVGIRKKG